MSLVLPVRKVLPVLPALLAHKVQRGKQVLLARRDLLVKRVLPVPKVRLVSLVLPALRVLPVLPAP